jgi:hypothetical protein
MSNVVSIRTKLKDGDETSRYTRTLYLEVCKNAFNAKIYTSILCSILDKEIYESSDPKIQKIVDSYYQLRY